MCTVPPTLRSTHCGRGAHTKVAHPECIRMSAGGKSSLIQPGLGRSDPLKSSPGSHSLLVSNSVGIMSSCSLLTFPSLSQPRVVSTLPLLLSIHLKLIPVLDYS